MPSSTVYNFSVSKDDLNIVEATLPLVAKAGADFTKHFYKILFVAHPELKNLFNQTNQAKGKQPQKLVATVAIAAQAAIKDGVLPGEAIEGICQKHSALGVSKEAYEVVGVFLLQTIKDLLTEDEGILTAWGNLYQDIAAVFTTREGEIAQEALDRPGGWVGRRQFVLKKKQSVSSIIERFTFAPVDGKAIPSFIAGQFTTVWVPVEGEGIHGSFTEQPRHYTLAVPNQSEEEGCLSISVKKEGSVSQKLHAAEIGSEWDLSAPRGSFVMSGVEKLWLTVPDAPIIFLSAGVGITPVLAMLENILETRPVSWLHAARNGDVHAYRDRLRTLASVRKGHLKRRVWYSNPLPEDGSPTYEQEESGVDEEKKTQNPSDTTDGARSGSDKENMAKYHFHGRMDPSSKSYHDHVVNTGLLHADNPNANYFMCGPEGFMEAQRQALLNLGIPSERIHSEGF